MEKSETVVLEPHAHRSAILEEVHARPFRPVASPARLLHFAFLSAPEAADGDRRAFSEFCVSRGAAPVPEGARHHRVCIGDADLRWERHAEFTSYCWYRRSGGSERAPVSGTDRLEDMLRVPRPGPHLVSIDLEVVAGENAKDVDKMFARESLCVMAAEKQAVRIATDFKPDEQGFVRFLVIDGGVAQMRMGALVQRLLELETYRVLALLCLPEVQRLEPSVRKIERELVEATQTMTQALTLEDNERLLDRLVVLAAQLEAGAARSLFRFGASRAYQNIVHGRITAISPEPVPDRETFNAFLSRRMAPALQTCFSLEERQINLSRKLARATQLLRAKVDVAIERQNRDILHTMSERARLQLRLQQTVEGLSIAAVSYYVVGLLAYFIKGSAHAFSGIDPELVVAALVPAVLAAVAVTVRAKTRHATPGAQPLSNKLKAGKTLTDE